jgi:hypothetical protein
VYNLNYTPTTSGVQSRKEVTSGGRRTKIVYGCTKVKDNTEDDSRYHCAAYNALMEIYLKTVPCTRNSYNEMLQSLML